MRFFSGGEEAGVQGRAAPKLGSGHVRIPRLRRVVLVPRSAPLVDAAWLTRPGGLSLQNPGLPT